jgi:CHAD domain-containing protein
MAKALLGETLAAIWSALADQMEQQCQSVCVGDDIEALHRFRVALRKTRALYKLHVSLLPETSFDFGAEFSWLADATGPVRDLDVLLQFGCEELPDLLMVDARELTPLLGILRGQRDCEQQALQVALRSARYDHLLRQWRLFLARLPSAPLLQMPLRPALRVRALALCVRLLKMRRGMRFNVDPARLHAMRIRCKRLRYLIDTMSPYSGGDALDALIGPLTRLQTVLGNYQDAAVARKYLKKLLASPLHQVVVAALAARWLGVLDTQQAQAWREFDGCFDEFAFACANAF